ncbi:hypothetical protein DFJ73DRAFT_856154 [Zopfochytrium polystomum]|nr:hypothetical protein DFJ73DRAFT_856154 [Zopfochytrium polystomum]
MFRSEDAAGAGPNSPSGIHQSPYSQSNLASTNGNTVTAQDRLLPIMSYERVSANSMTDNYPIRRSMDSIQSQQHMLMLQTHHQQQQEQQNGSSSSKRPKKKHFLHKTELCRTWRMYGTCPYGSKCQFAHSESELRVVTRHPKWKTALCKRYWMTGTCPYGDQCSFIHRLEESAIFRQGPADIPPLAASRQQQLQLQNQAPVDSVWQQQTMATGPAQLWEISQQGLSEPDAVQTQHESVYEMIPKQSFLSTKFAAQGETPIIGKLDEPILELDVPSYSVGRTSTTVPEQEASEGDASPAATRAPRRSFTFDSNYNSPEISGLSRSQSMSASLLDPVPFISSNTSTLPLSPSSSSSSNPSLPTSPLLPLSPPSTPLAGSPDSGRLFSGPNVSSTGVSGNGPRTTAQQQTTHPVRLARPTHTRSQSFHSIGVTGGKSSGFSSSLSSLDDELSSSPPSSFLASSSLSSSPVLSGTSATKNPLNQVYSQPHRYYPHSGSLARASSISSSSAGLSDWEPEQELLAKHLRTLKISPTF